MKAELAEAVKELEQALLEVKKAKLLARLGAAAVSHSWQRAKPRAEPQPAGRLPTLPTAAAQQPAAAAAPAPAQRAGPPHHQPGQQCR